MSTHLLSLDSVTVGFGFGPDVLRDVSLDVQPGEFLSVIGPSGCGKSTILNVVAGLLGARAGTTTFDGVPVRGINTDVGYMTQGDTLLPWRSVFENIALPLRIRHVPGPEIKERVAAMLDMLQLTGSESKFPGQLSGGMRRRALLARSTIYEPKMLLMDEPFAALDAQLRAQMHEQLLDTVRRLGQTVLFITHDLYEAVLLSDRVIVLGGTPAQVTATFDIPFGADRDLAALRFAPEFGELERRVHDELERSRVLTAPASEAAAG
jgi:NitT/TauT family transport system ATP-binding protein